jgi:hypothetical protein
MMNLEQIELLIDLVEIRLETFCVIDKEDVFELENLRHCRQELGQMQKKASRKEINSCSSVLGRKRSPLYSTLRSH